MGMAAMLVMWPWPFEQFNVPKTPGGYIWNLVTIGPAVSEEMSSVWNCWPTDDGRTDNGALPSIKLPRSRWLRWAKNASLCLKFLIRLQFCLNIYMMHKMVDIRFHECSCIIEFIKRVGGKIWDSLASYLFPQLVIQEHECTTLSYDTNIAFY